MARYQVTIVPMFVMFHRLGWVDTFKPLMIPPDTPVDNALYYNEIYEEL